MDKTALYNEATAKVRKCANKIRKSNDYSESALEELRQLMTDYLMIDYPFQMSEFWCKYSLERLILEYNRLSGKYIRL